MRGQGLQLDVNYSASCLVLQTKASLEIKPHRYFNTQQDLLFTLTDLVAQFILPERKVITSKKVDNCQTLRALDIRLSFTAYHETYFPLKHTAWKLKQHIFTVRVLSTHWIIIKLLETLTPLKILSVVIHCFRHLDKIHQSFIYK